MMMMLMIMIMTINNYTRNYISQYSHIYAACVMKVEEQNHLSPSRAWPASYISLLKCDPNHHRYPKKLT